MIAEGRILEHVITSLAILKVNWDRGYDYIENFVPFVAECLRIAPQPEVSLPELQAAMFQTFGLRIPQGSLKTILKRAVKRGYLEPTKGIYRRNEDALATLDFASTRADVLRDHEALIGKLINFCNTRHKISWSQKDAEAALLMYIKDRSMPILAAAVEGEPIPTPDRQTRHAEFLVNAFIAHLCERDSEGFEMLETVVKGSMLASVLFFPELHKVGQRFERVEVYFDTPFLLRALGLAGPSMQAPRRELLDLLYELDGELRCFEHTVEEIQGVLDAAARALRDRHRLRSARGEVLDRFINQNYRASDVELIIARLERSLRALRVQVKSRPLYTEALGVDEEKFESILQEEVRYFRKEALLHDLDSLTAIHRLRRGQFPYQIESCKAIFVTTNSSLARASARFFREEYGDGDIRAPHCILDHLFITIVWLKKPVRAPDLPRKQIIADCYAALNPSDHLWRLYLEEIQRLQNRGDISEEDYDLLRFSTEARDLLMEVTYGAPDAFTEGTIPEVLEKARAEVRAEAEAALEAEREKRLEAERRVAAAERQHQAQLDRFRSIAARGGYWVGRTALAIGVAIAALAVYWALPKPFPRVPGVWGRFIAPAAAVGVAILSIRNLAFGTTLNSLARRLEIRVSRLIEQTLTRILIPRNI